MAENPFNGLNYTNKKSVLMQIVKNSKTLVLNVELFI